MKKICVVCHKEYDVKPYLFEKSKYCSVYCHNHGNYEHIEKKCLECGKTFHVSSSRITKKFCSDICSSQSHKNIKERREQSKLWQKMNRGNVSSRTLRKYVFSIKPKQCEICGYNEYDFCLDVHHIDENCLNHNIENLKVLCCMCHRKYHKKIIDINGKKI